MNRTPYYTHVYRWVELELHFWNSAKFWVQYTSHDVPYPPIAIQLTGYLNTRRQGLCYWRFPLFSMSFVLHLCTFSRLLISAIASAASEAQTPFGSQICIYFLSLILVLFPAFALSILRCISSRLLYLSMTWICSYMKIILTRSISKCCLSPKFNAVNIYNIQTYWS